VAIAAGVDRDTASGCANGLRSVAKRLGVEPAQTARTRRTACGGRARRTHRVYRYTLRQVSALVAAYRPRKAEYVAATARIAAFAA
jgi:peptidyl-tRNA hydrolase